MKQFSLEEYLANPTKKVVTRDGGNVRIVCTDVKSEVCPVLALVDNGDEEVPTLYTKYGKFILNDEYPCDLFFAPEKHEGWINIYRDSNNGHTYTGTVFDSQEDAENVAQQKIFSHVTTIKIEWEE